MNAKQYHSSNHGSARRDGLESRPDVIQKSRKTTPDFSIRDEGSIVLLTPLSPSVHEFVEERIGLTTAFNRTGRPSLSNGAAALPKMSAQERADLSRMAHRNFSSDLDAYRFWHELVTTAAFFHVFEGSCHEQK